MKTATTTPLAMEHVPIDALRPDPANPRHITSSELEALTRSISEFGLIDPILARRADWPCCWCGTTPRDRPGR